MLKSPSNNNEFLSKKIAVSTISTGPRLNAIFEEAGNELTPNKKMNPNLDDDEVLEPSQLKKNQPLSNMFAGMVITEDTNAIAVEDDEVLEPSPLKKKQSLPNNFGYMLITEDIYRIGRTSVVKDLRHREREMLELSLQKEICEEPIWEMLCRKLIDEKLIQISRNEFQLIKHPNCRRVGERFIDSIEVHRPNTTVHDFRTAACDNERYDINGHLRQYKSEKLLMELPVMVLAVLSILCSKPVQRGGWKTLAESIHFKADIISALEAEAREPYPNSPVMQMFNYFEARNPNLTLHDILKTLRELQAFEAFYTLKNIIELKGREEKRTELNLAHEQRAA